jgi:hypothetical protein
MIFFCLSVCPCVEVLALYAVGHLLAGVGPARRPLAVVARVEAATLPLLGARAHATRALAVPRAHLAVIGGDAGRSIWEKS